MPITAADARLPATAVAFDGRVCDLSPEIFVLTSDSGSKQLGSAYRTGTVVRRIAGVHGSTEIGYHPRKGFTTVSAVDRPTANFVGVNVSILKRIETADELLECLRRYAIQVGVEPENLP